MRGTVGQGFGYVVSLVILVAVLAHFDGYVWQRIAELLSELRDLASNTARTTLDETILDVVRGYASESTLMIVFLVVGVGLALLMSRIGPGR